VTGRQAAAPAGPAPESPRLLVTQSLSQPDDPPSTQSVLWSAARRVRPRRTAPHGACGAMRHVGCSSRRTPASRRAFKLFKYESLEATCYYAMDRDNLLGCVGQCVHSPLGPDTRPVAGVACSEPTEVRRGGCELVSDTVKWC